jgi:hypothetical protein
VILALFAAFLLLPSGIFAQASVRAQLRGTVTDSSGAALTHAKVTVTDVGTNQSQAVETNSTGEYIVRALRPANYTVKVEAPGFRPELKEGVVLQVDQQSSLNFTMRPAGGETKVEVTEAAPLLDSDDPSLGTDITNEYVKQIPLANRNFFGLVFLNAGVTEVAGSGTTDNYPAGTNFVSNGQRNATAEIRMDGSLISAPEQGEGGNSNVYYEPSVEAVQEFKVQSSPYSAEYGSNGGTVVNMALKSGTNKLHGSAWWFGQRSWLDANDFFSDQAGLAKPDHSRDQYGFSVGGPIKKNKTFFFFDLERVKEGDPVPIVATVPTAEERKGNFSNSLITDPNTGDVVPNLIFNPLQVSPGGTRQAFSGNMIPAQYQDAIGQKLLALYPLPNQPGDPDGTNNFRANTIAASKGLQFDFKIDHQLNDKNHLAFRLSYGGSSFSTPTIMGDGEFNDGIKGTTTIYNAGLQHDWTISPTLLLSSRFSVDRVSSPGQSNNYPTAASVEFPSVLANANAGIDRMPALLTDSPWTSLFDQCCGDTNFAHTLYSYSSVLSWSRGKHNWKFGGEERMFFNNFQQPSYPTGYFHFGQTVTEQVVNAFNPDQGNPFADMLVGMGDYGGISIYPAVANKSMETAFYAQDEWKITPKLTLSLGLRYEWSSPYTERFDRLQYSNFNGSSGVSIPALTFNQDGVNVTGPWNASNLAGTTLFPQNTGNRSVPTDRNNFAPRIGFAYALTPNTVIRGGAGIFYGMNVATNFQYTGTAFRKDGNINFTLNNFESQYATFANPFPAGLPQPEGTQYGPLSMWGYPNQNDLGTQTAQNADIYQWSFGVQRLLPWQTVLSVDYSANRSTHLPWGGAGGINGGGPSTRDRNYIPSSIRQQFDTLTLYNDLHNTVTNPFYSLFQGPNAVFNQPDSIYNDPEIPLLNLLRLYPQFDGPFEGLPLLGASSWYNALQIRFQKRMTNYISFEGGYTWSKETDDSSVGRNAWVGSLASDNPQELDNLKPEWSIGANDATNRLALGVVGDLPIGRGRWIGGGMNRWEDGVIGGWTLSSIITIQSGQPMDIGMSEPTLDDGNQRPNVICNPLSGTTAHSSAFSGASMFNSACFANPGYEQPGNAPRYFSNIRTDGIHNVDFSFSKSFVPHEGMKFEVRGDFFNFFNHPRFAQPDTLWGDSTFGQVTSILGSPRHGQFGLRFEF